MKNLFKILGLAILIFGFSSQVTFAKAELIEAKGSYVMDLKVDETFATGTARAREEAKRAAAEKAGVYVQSYSKTINLELEYDEIQTVAAQILKVQDEKISQQVLQDNLLEITVTIKAVVDGTDTETLKKLMTDKQNLTESTERYKKLQEEYDALKKQMEDLKKQYANSNDSQKAQIKNSIAKNGEYFNALLELEQGNNFYFRKDYKNAISAYSRALQINPNFAEAYNNRGNAYVQLKNYQQAMQDLQNAVRLNNADARIHNNLGGVYLLLENYNAAISEYTQAINLNPNLFSAYFNRSLAYCYTNRFQEALPDVQRAMQLNPADVDAKNLYDQISRRL